MRYAVALILLCSIFACGTPTAPQVHQDGECRTGYLMSSGGQCVPQNRVPVANSGSIPSFDVLCWVEGRGYLITAGDKCPDQ